MTNTYPYDYGESFLEVEIEYLAKEFKKVIILPFRKSSHSRNIPENVIVDDTLTRKSRLNIFFLFFLKSLRSNNFKEELKKITINNIVIDFGRVLLFCCKSLYIGFLIENLIKENKLSIKNSIFYTYWLTSAAHGVGLLRKKYPLIKIVSRAHGYDLYSERYFSNYIPMQLETIANLDRLFLISKDGYQYLNNKYKFTQGFIEEKMIVSRLGVKEYIATKSCWEIQKNSKTPFLIVTCSSIIPVKRIDLLINALAILDKKYRGKKIEWHHIGGGRSEKQIKRMAKNNLSQQVTYEFHGVLTNNEVLALYNNCSFDLFVNTSDSEGIPVSIMEALSASIPVVARNVGGISEIVNNRNGFLLDAMLTPEKLAEILLKIIASEEVLLIKRKEAIDFWRKNFYADINYKKFVNILLEI